MIQKKLFSCEEGKESDWGMQGWEQTATQLEKSRTRTELNRNWKGKQS